MYFNFISPIWRIFVIREGKNDESRQRKDRDKESSKREKKRMKKSSKRGTGGERDGNGCRRRQTIQNDNYDLSVTLRTVSRFFSPCYHTLILSIILSFTTKTKLVTIEKKRRMKKLKKPMS